MSDFVVIKKGAYTGETLEFSDGNQSRLILQQSNFEIAVDFMPKGSAGIFYVPGGTEMTEVNYILSGAIELRDRNEATMITDGDFFYQAGDVRYLSFEVHEDTRFFYINNRPYFDVYEKQISGLMQILNQLQEVDGDTLFHCERVKKLCLGIAHYIGFDQEKLDVLFYAARFHDVGKAKIPPEILLKPGRLTNEEYEIMKRHSQYTYEMILEYYGAEIAIAAYGHHEYLDGRGYPNQLREGEIRLDSRIISVADAYDAMVMTRPYHVGKSPEAALKELWRCAGTQFDGRVIQGLADYLDSRAQFEPICDAKNPLTR